MSTSVPSAAGLRGLIALAAAAALVWLAQSTLSAYVLTLLAILLLNAGLAVSLTLTNGLTGLFSLGHPAFMTIGAYAAAILTFPAGRKGTMLPALPAFVDPVSQTIVVEADLLKADPELLPGMSGTAVFTRQK